MTASFELDGQEFVALNGGPTSASSQGISLFVSCETQAEIDELWAKLPPAAERGACGWLTDKFGVSWQIVPNPRRADGRQGSGQEPAGSCRP